MMQSKEKITRAIVSHTSLTIVSRAGVPGSVYQSCFVKIR